MADLLLVALGSNLPGPEGRTPLETCRWAVGELAGLPGLALRAASAVYRTAPMPASDQPNFINGVVRLAGEIAPERLLAALHTIEAEAGRRRTVPNAARPLDLDLLVMDDQEIDRPDLVLPHPRLAERAFVLYPLCDIAPEWRHPRLGATAAELRDRLPPQPIERLPARYTLLSPGVALT